MSRGGTIDFLTDRRQPSPVAVSGIRQDEPRELLALIPRGAVVEFGGVESVWPGHFFREFAGYWIERGMGDIRRDGAALVIRTPAGLHRVNLSGPADAGTGPAIRAPKPGGARIQFFRGWKGGSYVAHSARD